MLAAGFSSLFCLAPLLLAIVHSTPAVVTFKHARFTLITQSLVRMEHSLTGHFDDRPSVVVQSRFVDPPPKYNTSFPDSSTIRACTQSLCITYTEAAEPTLNFTAKNLRVDALTPEGQAITWVPGRAQKGNLNGTYVSLDCYNNPVDCYNGYWSGGSASWEFGMEPGLLARDGWNVLDDTWTLRMVTGSSLPWWSNVTVDSHDLYFHVYGIEYRRALSEFATITGPASLPPRATFGNMWSRYYAYSERSFTDEILSGFADHSVPLHVAFLDMDWHAEPTDTTCGSWGSYDFNTSLFPDPQGFIDFLHSDSNPLGHPVLLSLNMHPQGGIDHCHSRYLQMAKAFGWDVSRNATIPCLLDNQQWVEALYSVYLDVQPLADVDMLWTDFGGCGAPWPANPDVRSLAETEQLWATIVFGSHMQVVRKQRPVVVARQGGLGNHRIPMGFSGDTFQHELALDFQIQTTQTAANVLNGWWSHDIGGNHVGQGCPGTGDPSNYTASELLLRWVQFGVLSPMFRTHCDHCIRTPWSFPFHAEELMDAYRFRASLLPYTYTIAREYVVSGVAFVHPVYYEHPTHEEAYAFTHQYMFGELLVAPISEIEGGAAVKKAVWVPPGEWMRWDGSSSVLGPAVDTASYSAAQIPLFVRAGTLLPLQPPSQLRPSTSPPVMWTLWISRSGSANANGSASVYEDDGASLDYLGSSGAVTRAIFHANQTHVTVNVGATTGSYKGIPATRAHSFQIIGLQPPKRDPRRVRVNNVDVAWSFVQETTLSTPSAGALLVDAGRFSLSQTVTLEILV